MKYNIARPINGISLNGIEYLMDKNDNILEFDTRQKTLDYLKDIAGDQWKMVQEDLDEGAILITKGGKII